MFNITPYITLTKKQKKHYNLMRIGLFGVFILVALLFTKELLFPTQFFQFNSAVDSLANTISRPYETSKGTGFHISAYGESDTIKISLTLPKDSPKLPKDTTALIRKSYLSFLSPINNTKYTGNLVTTYSNSQGYFIVEGEVIKPLISKNAFESYLFKNNTADMDSQVFDDIAKSNDYVGFAPATLISSKDSIYVTDGDTKHPFQDERAFEAMGYNYDNVINTNSEERALHKKAKLFTVRSAHPFGTIFYAQDADRTYIYDNDMLNKIPTTKISKQHAITAQELSRDTTASCTLKKHLFSHKYSCTAPLKDIQDFEGNTYQIALEDAPSTQIKTANIKLFTTANDTSLAQRVEAIKRRLNTIYN
jgi:hypothetical protein